MCTINSLERRWHLFSFIPYFRAVLIFCVIGFHQDSSGALWANAHNLSITVVAPADITINIKRSAGCDTLINLPGATFSGNCPGPLTFTTKSIFNTLNTNGGNMYFTTGVFKVYYVVSDNCGMSGMDSMQVSVFDSKLPNVICNPKMTMSLPSGGILDAPAWIFDAGSTDSCGHVYFKVKRMFPTAGYTCDPDNPKNAFDDQVRFCCKDVDSNSIRIILRVYDVFPGFGQVTDSFLIGRYVDCMVEAIVKDKIPPDIDCPKNITVNCGIFLDSLLAANPNLVVSDNCGLDSVQSILVEDLNACGAGTIRRTFIATDIHGLRSSCTQIITVLKKDTFNGLDPSQLKWPDNKLIYACRIDPDTINAGLPLIREDGCANVLTTHHDEKYNFDRGGVCAKILRYWDVIDWCVYNPGLLPNPKISSNGYYSHIQEIKIMDTVPPILTGLKDTVIGIQTFACQPGFVNLPAVTASDCGSSANISIRYEVDYYNDGSIDISGPGGNASNIFPIGSHHLKFYANDSCHNTGTLDVMLIVIDAKPPDVKAIFGLSSSLIQMQAGPMVSILAKVFNENSTDNCTDVNALRYSYSSDINDTIRIYNCDSLGLRSINLVVWDQSGNSSQVNTFITIDDVDKLCPGSLPGVQVSGQIQTSNDQSIKDVDVHLSYDNIDKHAITDQNGRFIFNAIPKNKNVKINARCNKDFNNGISTADIIKIQRHILGIDVLKTPDDILAADVDLNHSISTKDIIWLRKLILGQITEIPNQDSYVFINKNFVFLSPENPFKEMDSCQKLSLQTIQDSCTVELIGIKLGDVNHSYRANGIQFGNAPEFNLTYKMESGLLQLFPAENGWIDGFQFDFGSKDLCLDSWTTINSNLENWSNANYKIDGNKIRVSYSQEHSFLVNKENPLIVIPSQTIHESCIPYLELHQNFDNEVYSNNEIFEIHTLNAINSTVISGPEFINVLPNPFTEKLQILLRISESSVIHIDIFSLDLKTLYSKVYELPQGENSILINKESLPQKGMYILEVHSNKTSQVFKIINE